MHAAVPERVLQVLHSSAQGLTQAEAERRLATHGRTVLQTIRPTPAWRIVLAQLRGVVTLLLLLAAVASVWMGDVAEAVAIGAVVGVNTIVGFVTEWRARRAMEALLRLGTSRATVLRDGHQRDVDAAELVPGDVIILESGAAVPADARVLDAADVNVDEAALTGESLPVAKHADVLPAGVALAERANMLYKGTTVLTGTARGVVTATGMDTELGGIGALVAAVREERTPLERRLDVLGRRLMWVALGSGLLVMAAGMLWGEAPRMLVETGIALAIAAVPEGLAVVATVALAVGMRRMARRQALVRRAPSVETLGSVTLVCTDKTGTLTAGEMTVTTFAFPDREIRVSGSGYDPVGEFFEGDARIDAAADRQLRLALHIVALATRADLEMGEDGWVVRGDPTEAALVVAARKAGFARERLLEAHPEAGHVPFSSERMLMATFHHIANDGLVAHVKGAPDRVLALCARELTADGVRALTPALRSEILRGNETLASRGLRVLALATGPSPTTDASALRDLTFVGLAGMLDAPAPGVRETIQLFREAGIRTVMITGDQRATAAAVGRDLGILGPGEDVLDAGTSAIAGMDDAELARRLADVVAFSRVTPKDKLVIVSAFQRRGDIVAMLGDGVNDAPALKKADVGVAMGRRGTDVARETAAIVLQDDRFATIGAAIEEGRVIFDNIRKVVFYLFSCNFAEILVLGLAAVAGFPLPLLPLQILYLNLVTDSFPALALAIEPAEHGVMRRRPRAPDAAILSRRFVVAIVTYGAMIAAVALAAFGIGFRQGTDARAMTMAFATLGLAQGLHLGNARRRESSIAPAAVVANVWALGALALVVVLQVAAVEWGPLQRALGTQGLSRGTWFLVVALASAPAVVGQLVKSRRQVPEEGTH